MWTTGSCRRSSRQDWCLTWQGSEWRERRSNWQGAATLDATVKRPLEAEKAKVLNLEPFFFSLLFCFVFWYVALDLACFHCICMFGYLDQNCSHQRRISPKYREIPWSQSSLWIWSRFRPYRCNVPTGHSTNKSMWKV